MNKSLEYYHKIVKFDKERMDKRRIYYKEYYKKNKIKKVKIKKQSGIIIKKGEFTVIFD